MYFNNLNPNDKCTLQLSDFYSSSDIGLPFMLSIYPDSPVPFFSYEKMTHKIPILRGLLESYLGLDFQAIIFSIRSIKPNI